MSTGQARDSASAQLGSPWDKDGIAHDEKKLPRGTWHCTVFGRKVKSLIKNIFVSGRPAM